MRLFNKSGSLLIWIGLLVWGFSANAMTVSIDASQRHQLIEGFGANINYSSWTNTDLQPVIDALVDQGGMTSFRVVLDNADWEGTNDNSDSNNMNWTYYNSIYSSPKFQQLWGLIGYLNQKGITNGIELNFQGPGPTWMGGSTLTSGYEDEWAEMIASLLYYARVTRGLKFNLVGPDNEPDNPPQGIAVNNVTQYTTMLRDLAHKLDTNGLTDIRFVAPELASTVTTYRQAMVADSTIMAKTAHFGMHSYVSGGADSANLYSFIQQSSYSNLTMWVTEFNVACANCEAGQYGTYDWTYCLGTAQYLFTYLSTGASGANVWEGYDSQYVIHGPRWSFWGLFGVNDTNATVKTYTPRKNFYTVSQISKFVAPGAYMINLTGNSAPLQQLLAFYHPVSGQLIISGINTSLSSTSLTANLSSLTNITSVDLYYTDPNSNLVHSATILVNNSANFTVTIPPNCVFTLVSSSPVSAQISYPVEGMQFNSPAIIPIQALAATTNGSISSVGFYYNGTHQLSVDTSGPYSFIWQNVQPGSYTLTIVATNSLGSVSTSPPVHITVIGPLVQVAVSPANVTLNPYDTQQFTAVGMDTNGTPLNPQPSFIWQAVGGTIDTNGLFTAGPYPGGSYGVTAFNGSITGSAAITIVYNAAPDGTGYTWYAMGNSNLNSPSVAAPDINDGDLLTSVPLQASGNEELQSNVWEAAGIVWAAPLTLNRIVYVNGSLDQNNDGVFASNFGLQFSPDGSTWTNAGPEWTVSPAYSYNSPNSSGVSFNFTGGQVSAQGVRAIGRVHTTSSSQNSWVAYATEVQAYLAAPPLLQTGMTSNGITLIWSSALTNCLLETCTNANSPTVWYTVTNSPQLSSNQFKVTLTPSLQQQFFRLRYQ